MPQHSFSLSTFFVIDEIACHTNLLSTQQKQVLRLVRCRCHNVLLLSRLIEKLQN